MADNVGYTPGSGATVAADEIAGVLHQRVKLTIGADGVNDGDVSAANPMPVSVSGTVNVSGAVADGASTTGQMLLVGGQTAGGVAQVFETNASGHLNIADGGGSITVDGPLTDAQLRASAVPVSGTVTADTGLTQPLTDTQLRATPVAVSGTVTANTGLTQPLTDTQLRASAVPVSASALPLPTGAATEATLANLLTTTAFQARIPVNGQATMAASVPVAIASNQTAVPVSLPNQTTATYNQAGVIAINTDLLVIDCKGLRAVAVQCSSMGTTGVVTPAWSNDGTNYPSTATLITTGGTSIATFNAAGFWVTPVFGRFLRLRLTTATTGGTTTLTVQGLANSANLPLVQQNIGGSVAVSSIPALIASSVLIGDVGVQYRANATGAASFVSVLSPATPVATVCKASAGRLLGWSLVNSHASAIRSVKFWNTAQGSVSLGTTAALFEIDIQPGGRSDIHLPGGIGFATAITFAVTGAKGLTDNSAITVNDVSGALFFA